MEIASAGLLGAVGGFLLGKNWKRVKRGLSWLGDRIKEEVEALNTPLEAGVAEYDHRGHLICEYVFVHGALGGYHIRLDRYGNAIPDEIPARLF